MSKFMNKSRIEIIFDFFYQAKKPLQLHELWNALVDQIDWHTEDKHRALTTLFTDLVLDERFCLMEDGSWNIRANLGLKDKLAKNSYPNQFDDLKKFKDLPKKQQATTTIAAES